MQTKEQKKLLVEKISQELRGSKAVIFSDFKGFIVKDMMALRRELAKAGITFTVAKKTLISLALKEAGIPMDAKQMEGQIAVAISSDDEVTGAKIIAKVAKSNENLKIVGGLLGEKVLTVEEVKALAKLPSQEELLSKLVYVIKSPMTGMVNVLSGNTRSLVQVLKAIAEKPAV